MNCFNNLGGGWNYVLASALQEEGLLVGKIFRLEGHCSTTRAAEGPCGMLTESHALGLIECSECPKQLFRSLRNLVCVLRTKQNSCNLQASQADRPYPPMYKSRPRFRCTPKIIVLVWDCSGAMKSIKTHTHTCAPQLLMPNVKAKRCDENTGGYGTQRMSIKKITHTRSIACLA